MTPLMKYIWLIKLLHDSDGKTFESINKEWLKFRQNTEDKNMPIQKRTFHNHIKAIREEYGIHIECGPGYKYYISDSININDDGFEFFYLKDNIFTISDDLIKVFNLHENITK